MKKHLIAAAVAAAVAVPAMAQNVEIYGVIDKAYSSIKTATATTTVKNTTTGGSGNGGTGSVNQNYTTERLGFRGSEDLGGGLKANFVYELRIPSLNSADSGDEPAAAGPVRQSAVGLSGGFGSVMIGRQTALMEDAWGAGNSSNTNNFLGTLYASGQKFNNSRSDRVITYRSPAFSGFTFAVQYGTSEVKTSPAAAGDASQDEMTVNLGYSSGPFNAVLSVTREEAKAGINLPTTAKPEATVFGANYNFGPAVAFFTYAEGKNKLATTANDRDAYELGVRIPLGNIVLQGSFFDGSEKPAPTTENDVKGYQVSLLYNFSKRTNLYAVIGSDENKSTTTTTKTERDVYGVGIRHQF